MEKQISVRELNSYVKNFLENDQVLSNLWIKGEVSNLKKAMSGHIYFTLKDEYSAISVAFFKSYARLLDFDLKDGQEIIVRGKVSIYEKTGAYQLYAREVNEVGLGNIYVKIEQLKNRLLKEGLFDSKYKKELPKDIQRIGVLTSSKGAVLHDIKEVVGKRNPTATIYLYPVAVQGIEAPKEIINGIRVLNTYEDLDVIIVARGGGSLEDLMAFNDEGVVREVFKSNIPVVSAVGHETDTTLIDYVADIRGATPSQGAEIVTDNVRERLDWLKKILLKNENKIKSRINDYYQELDLRMDKLSSFSKKINDYEDKLYLSFKSLNKVLIDKIKYENLRLNHLGEKLHLVSPLQLLNKGYSIIYKDGKIVNRTDILEVKDEVKVKLYDGSIKCIVTGKED